MFGADSLQQDFQGTISGIGFESATFSVTGSGDVTPVSQQVTIADHRAAMKMISAWLNETLPAGQLAGIAHRVVHGGPTFSEPCIITEEVVAGLQEITVFDPEHLPVEIELIGELRLAYPDIPHVACFDTAFWHDLPTVARLLPIPRRYQAKGLRRYGFHGLSYDFLMNELSRIAGPEAAMGKVVIAHLGNGASLAAITNSKPVDTSMGLTPAGGVPMSTRSGDLDPGVVTYLADAEGLDTKAFADMTGFESGLLGLSETSSDMKKLLEIESEDSRAAEAVALFCYQVKKCIGAYAAAMGGINTLIFSGGMGEQAPKIRARVCEGLEFLGIRLDESRNLANSELISAEGSGAGVHVLHTDEAVTMAHELVRIIGNKP